MIDAIAASTDSCDCTSSSTACTAALFEVPKASSSATAGALRPAVSRMPA